MLCITAIIINIIYCMLITIQSRQNYVKPLFMIYMFIPSIHYVMSCEIIVLSTASSSAASIILWFKVDNWCLVMSVVVMLWSSLTGWRFPPPIENCHYDITEKLLIYNFGYIVLFWNTLHQVKTLES